MNYPDNQVAGVFAFERGDSYSQRVDGVVSQTIARAIRDATQTTNLALQQEAASWLWICCPDVAEQVELPELHYHAMPTQAAAYSRGDVTLKS